MIADLVAWFGPEFWLGLGLVLLIAELTTGTTYLLWPAAAAGVTGLVSLMARPGWQVEIALFAVLVIVLTLVGRPFARNMMRADAPALNERGADLLGVRVQVSSFADGVGAVKLNDTMWRIVSADALNAGDEAEVIAVEGVTLKVKKAM